MSVGHGHSHDGGHGHTHGGVDSSIVQSKEATTVLLISLVGLLVTAVVQAVIVAFSGSVALLADTIHNFGDALTSIPLWFAFVLSRRLPTKRFTYGLNRSEDIAGMIIVLVIAVSAVIAGYESIRRIIHGTSIDHLGAVALAAIIGFLGNEIVAVYRIRMGKRMGSAALVADGHHARVDGITSLAVLIGVAGTWLGFPIVDPIVGLGITVMIMLIVKDSAKTVFTRILDGIEPEKIEQITSSASNVDGVLKVNDVKARWFGHEILADVSITVDSDLPVKQGHQVVKNVIHRLQHDVEHLSTVQVHVDPVEEQGQSFHAHENFHEHNDHGHHGHAPEYPFEWAGVYELSVGDHEFVLNAGPDPAMRIAFFELSESTQDAFEAAKVDAVKVFRSDMHALSSGGILQSSHSQTQLLLDGDVTFLVHITKPGSYALFTEHHPDEFAAGLHQNGSIIPVSIQQSFPSSHGHH